MMEMGKIDIAASCSGVLLLAMTGLINGRTTHARDPVYPRRSWPTARYREDRRSTLDGLPSQMTSAEAPSRDRKTWENP
ncbi:MAG: hypothetical protein WA968_05560 [Castellaniella sp.]